MNGLETLEVQNALAGVRPGWFIHTQSTAITHEVYSVVAVSMNSESTNPRRIFIQRNNNSIFPIFLSVEDGITVVRDSTGNLLPEFDPTTIEVRSFSYRPTDKRSPQEMYQILHRERSAPIPICDEHGREVCVIQRDLHDGGIATINPLPYTDTNHGAEQPNEYIYLIDKATGDILPERGTRQSARDNADTYLVVSTLLNHKDHILLQQRSMAKDIDPGKYATSAHGVASEMYIDDARINDIHEASLLNSAMEMNEELFFGTEATPPHIVIWPGTAEELFDFARAYNINDEHTVFFIPLLYDKDGGYPLHTKANNRARALNSAFIFSEKRPSIHPDPAEVENYTWKKPSQITGTDDATWDTQVSIDCIVGQIFNYSWPAQQIIRDWQIHLHGR